MESLNFLPKKIKSTCDAVLTSEVLPKKTSTEYIKNIFSQESSNYLRLRAILDITKDIIPKKILEKYKSSIYDNSKTPFNLTEKFDFKGVIGLGTESIVYLLKSKELETPSYVFKVMLPTKHDNSINTLTKLAKEKKQEYEDISKRFIEEPDLIPKENFIITQDPKIGEMGAVISIQEFMGYDLRDLFNIPIEKIQDMCKKNPHLIEEIKKFAQINTKIYEKNGEIIDLGPNNAFIKLTQNKKPHLVFIDPHSKLSINSKNSKQKKRFQYREKRLKELQHIAENI